MLNAKFLPWPLTLWLLLMMLAGCSSKSPTYHADPPAVPALPSQARQTPSEYCSPSCLKKLTELRSEWQKKLTDHE